MIATWLKELLKWGQAAGAGAIVVALEYLKAAVEGVEVTAGTTEALLVGVLVFLGTRAIGWALSKVKKEDAPA